MTGLIESSGKHQQTNSVNDSARTETEVKTTVDDDTNNGWDETTVETADTVRSERLPVNVHEAGKLTGAACLCRLVVIGKTGTGVV